MLYKKNGFTSRNFDLCWKQKWRVGQRSTQNTWLLVAYLYTDGFNLEIVTCGFVMQRQILINVIIFVAFVLNLPLNTQRPYHHSQLAGKLGLDFGSWQSPDISRSHLYRGTIAWTPPTAIYIGSTLYYTVQPALTFVHCRVSGLDDIKIFLLNTVQWHHNSWLWIWLIISGRILIVLYCIYEGGPHASGMYIP